MAKKNHNSVIEVVPYEKRQTSNINTSYAGNYQRSKMELFKISKFVYKETFMDALLASSGNQKEQYIQKIEKNSKYADWNSKTIKFFTGFFIAIINILLLFSLDMLYEYVDYIQNEIMFNYFLFAFSAAANIILVSQSIYVIVMGITSLSGIFQEGMAFKFLETLPLKKEEKQRIVLFTFFRSLDVQIVGMLIGLPITTGISVFLFGGTILGVFAAIIVSVYNIIFVSAIAIFLSYFLAKKVFKIENTSKAQSVGKVIFTIIYMAAIMSMSFLFSFVILWVSEMFAGSGNVTESLFLTNALLSFIPFPFSGSIFFGIFLFPADKIYWSQVWPVILGFAVSCVITLFLFLKSIKLLNSVTKEVEVGVKHESGTDVLPISIIKRVPRKAILSKDIKFLTRDFSATLYVIMPILLSAVSLMITGGVSDFNEVLIVTNVINLIYSTQGIVFLVWGLTNVENDSGGLILTLPIKHSDVYKEKRFLILFILMIAQSVSIVGLVFKNFDVLIQDYSRIMPLSLYFLNEIMLILFLTDFALTMYAVAFGKLRDEYTIQALNFEYKAVKSILIVVFVFGSKLLVLLFNLFMMTKDFPDYQIYSIQLVISVTIFILMRKFAHKVFFRK